MSEPVAWRYRPDDRAVWQYAEHRVVIDGWIIEPLYEQGFSSEALEALREMVRLADMGLEEALKEPEENGNYAAYLRAKRVLASCPPPVEREGDR